MTNTSAASADLVATFSASATGALIAVAPGTSWDAVALARPSAGADPVDALRSMGYELTYPEQASYNLKRTMDATGYARLGVRPVADGTVTTP